MGSKRLFIVLAAVALVVAAGVGALVVAAGVGDALPGAPPPMRRPTRGGLGLV